MAAAVDMGEVDEMHSKENESAVNGDLDSEKGAEDMNDDEEMQVDTEGECTDIKSVDDNSDEDGMSIQDTSMDENSQGELNIDNSDCDTSEALEKQDLNNFEDSNSKTESLDTSEDQKSHTEQESGLNDSSEDVLIVDSESNKQNGDLEHNLPKIRLADVESLTEVKTVINLDAPVKKKKKTAPVIQSPPRRSSRNLNKQKSYVEDKEEEIQEAANHSEESDIEEVLPTDPLAVTDPLQSEKPSKKTSNAAIVVKDTKSLVEIASKTSPNVGGKKEPTLVIIDTNSILSGRGPVPLVSKQKQSNKSLYTKPSIISKSSKNMAHQKSMLLSNKTSLTTKAVQNKSVPSFPLLPMALPAQGVYPPNMRATITPIPMNSTPSPKPATPQPPVLPTLTDDMFVVEAPSFIVPYVYEKPPLKEFKDFIKDIKNKILEAEKKDAEDDEDSKEKGDKSDEEMDADDKDGEKKSEGEKKDDADDGDVVEVKKSYSYFESPLGKFFVDIGTSLVQEFVQTDLLRQQKRKREREGGLNVQTNKTIQSLIKNLEYSKENNVPFKMETKKCEFCSFKTESSLAMAFHLETPHMKNYVYRCNFCSCEVRSPHDILFHMEAEHAIRGRLERAPAFHQCPNCPFEDNQKGKLTRHLVACMRKFKPERNLEPPVDWEPPAKIPRVPRMKQAGLAQSAGVYQALAKNPQYQMFTKLQQPTALMQRGRGRPSLGSPVISKPQQQLLRTGNTGMLYKQAMSGGSVLVPTSYQLTGNQLYQQQQQQTTPTTKKPVHQPSISITPLPRGTTTTATNASALSNSKPGDSKNSFVICEICDGYIKDLEQLRNHMQWIHKVKIHPKMIYNRPPLNCQKCQFRFFTDQGLERHLLGSHGLVTSSMQEAANKSKDAGRCPVCGRVYQWKLLNHVARDHNMTLKPAHLSYKCTVCTATFGMYKQFENHVYSAHSVVAKRVMDKKGTSTSTSSSSKNDALLKPLKINDEITIIPQPAKSGAKEGSPTSSKSNGNSVSVTSKSK